ncbi:MAG TPA: RDD family protein [Acidiferrobacter sp.]|nr:RDD family protein [Acidiferrobacter sp.]
MTAVFPISGCATKAQDGSCYAGFWRRMAASIVDNIVLLPVMSALAPTQWPRHLTMPAITRALVNSAAAHPERQLLGIAIGVLYSVVFWVRYLGTPGKLLWHCHVVDAHTLGPLTVSQSLLRNLGYLVSWGTLGLGFLWIAWDKRKQGFHDKIAGSVVLHVPQALGRRQE